MAPSLGFVLRNSILLSVCYFLGTTVLFANVSTTSVMTKEFVTVSKLATLPLAIYIVSSAVAMLPAGLLMQRFGYRPMFIVGTLLGAGGGVASACAVLFLVKSGAGGPAFLAILCAGCLLQGVSYGIIHYYRHVSATLLAHAKSKTLSVAIVVTGGAAAGLAGSGLSVAAKNIIPDHEFAGVYIFLTGAHLLHCILFLFVKLEDPSQDVTIPSVRATNVGKSVQAQERGGETPDEESRPILTVITQPRYLQAAICAALVHWVMLAVMSVTPLVITGGSGSSPTPESSHAPTPVPGPTPVPEPTSRLSNSFDRSSLVIGIHVFCMYLPALLVSRLVDWLGHVPVILVGLLGCAGGIGLYFIGYGSFAGAFASLGLVGLSWCIVFLSATGMLATTYRAKEKFLAQSINDTFIFSGGAVATLVVGVVFDLERGLTKILLGSEGFIFVALVGLGVLQLVEWRRSKREHGVEARSPLLASGKRRK